tara:strand:+ start:1124 stop:1312 length:189 start_codon:yes stop_codon:yes gene_type:complete
MRNTQLIDKRFQQMESRIKVLKFLLSRQSSVEDFKSELKNMEDILEDLKSLIERGLDPLRKG